MPFGILRSVTGQLEKVDIALATMGGLVEQQLSDCILAFERNDVDLADELLGRDAAIDDQERAIERQVVAILEERRPTGLPLRRAMTAIRIAAEMERIGDLSKNVAKRTTVIANMAQQDSPIAQSAPVVARMGRRALSQFSDSLDCLFKGNIEAARAVREADDQIDDLYNSIFREILVGMGQFSFGVAMGTHLVFIAKNFERIGDHATNIAERVHFTLTGQEIADDRPKSDVTSLTAVNG